MVSNLCSIVKSRIERFDSPTTSTRKVFIRSTPRRFTCGIRLAQNLGKADLEDQGVASDAIQVALKIRRLALVAALLGVACGGVAVTGSAEPEPFPSPQVVKSLSPDPDDSFGYELPPVSMFQPLGQEGCRPPSPLVVTESLATSEEIRVWALLLVNVPPSELDVGEEAKIVWRSDGSGDFDVFAISPNGKTVRSKPPVASHLSSNWERPGSEWGSYFKLSEPGCWEFQLRHGDSSARLWLVVDE